MFCVRLNCGVTESTSELAATPAELVMVTVCGALDWPGFTGGKVSCDGLTPISDACTVPVSGTLAAVTPRVDEEMVSVAALPPAAAGVKITCTVQLLPLFNAAPQVVVPIEKLPAAGPAIWKPTLARGAPPVLLTVSVCGWVATPSCCAVKLKLEGLTPNAGGCRPVPERATVCVRSASETFKAPVWLPVWLGAKITLMAQLACPANWVPQLFDV